MKHIIEYAFTNDHTVRVGIEAESADEALTKTRALFPAYQEVVREFFQALRDGNGGTLDQLVGFPIDDIFATHVTDQLVEKEIERRNVLMQETSLTTEAFATIPCCPPDRWRAQRWISDEACFHLTGPNGIACDIETDDDSEQADFLRVWAEAMLAGDCPPTRAGQLARFGLPTDMSDNDVRALITEALDLRHKTEAFMDDLAHGRAFKEKLPQASRSVTSVQFTGWVRAQAKEVLNPGSN